MLLCLDKLGELAKMRDDVHRAAEMFRRSYKALYELMLWHL